ncbi:MAG: hypothetical protein EB115_07035 [Betaproteobacteria bacterium]|nr:hypothetical protein [Betaproteobacteria bacterium]
MMSVQLEMLQAQILGLPVHERARLLDRLIESLDADQALEEAWDAKTNQHFPLRLAPKHCLRRNPFC